MEEDKEKVKETEKPIVAEPETPTEKPESVEKPEEELDVNNEVMDFLVDLKGLVLNMQETIEKMSPPVTTETAEQSESTEEQSTEGTPDSPVEEVDVLDDLLHED